MIFPAVDLRGGRYVRLVKGDRDAEIQYGDDPVAAAQRWVAEGAAWIHAIDLGAAFGEGDSLPAILDIARAVPVPVQAGGGIRDDDQAARLLDGGVRRVILGTRALQDPLFFARLLGRFGAERVVLALDVEEGEVKVKGWESGSGLDLTRALVLANDLGAAHILLTAIDRDGTLSGPRLPLIRQALEEGSLGVVAAGGIGSLDHLRSVLELRHPRLEGVVVGRALYEGQVSLPDSVRLAREYQR